MLNRRDFLKVLAATAGVFATFHKGALDVYSELLGANDAASSSTVVGTVRHIVTGLPISGALVSVADPALARPSSITAANGRYELTLPSGNYEIHAQAPNFIAMGYSLQQVAPSSTAIVDFEMIPINPSPEEQRIISEKFLAEKQVRGQGDSTSGLNLDLSAPIYVSAVPTTIRVDLYGTGSCVSMGLDDYLRHVVPYEIGSGWPSDTLKAQAVASRSYAVAYYLQNGCICTTTACQYYGPKTYSDTDAAVYATSGQVATYNGSVIWAFYFGSCNGVTTRAADHALSQCVEKPWSPVPYCQPRQCTVHGPYPSSCGYNGHGVGMCQTGVQQLGLLGRNYVDILNAYYTGIAVTGLQVTPTPTPTPVPTPTLISPYDGQMFLTGSSVTLNWASGWPGYNVQLRNADSNALLQSYSTSSPSWPLGSLPLGNYKWAVQGSDSSGNLTPFSSYYRFEIVKQILNTYFPVVHH